MSRCLDNNPEFESAVVNWNISLCGNGVVDAGEECDPGVGLSDSCCDSNTCLLEPHCDCSNDQACCNYNLSIILLKKNNLNFKISSKICTSIILTCAFVPCCMCVFL